tara:strand:- start:4399 stop:5070 length:672 start_codon:yes stop_codon:yes gene_type:complete
MSNDALVRDFMEYYAGEYPVRTEKFRNYSARLSGVSPKLLKAALDGLMADAKVSRLPSLADIVHKLPRQAGAGGGPVPENPDCPRGCKRGELILEGRDGYDFVAPCNCRSGRMASRAKYLRTVAVHNGLDLAYIEKERALDVVDYASRGVGPADVPAPLTAEQRKWMREYPQGPVAAAFALIAAKAKRAGRTPQLPPPKIDDERTPGQRRAARRGEGRGGDQC